MTTKQKESLENFKSKLLWFILPLLITFFTWITLTINNIGTDVEVTKTESRERKDLLEKIYIKVEDNYKILESKADEQSNKKEHEVIFIKLLTIENKVNKIYNNGKDKKNTYTYKVERDSVFQPYKYNHFLNNKKNTSE